MQGALNKDSTWLAMDKIKSIPAGFFYSSDVAQTLSQSANICQSMGYRRLFHRYPVS